MMRPEQEQVLHYLGVSGEAPRALLRQIESVGLRIGGEICPRSVYRVFALEHRQDALQLAGSAVRLTDATSRSLLSGCHAAALFACTLGLPYDALLRREQARDMSDAVVLDAYGSAWVEQVCEETEREIAAAYPACYLTDRFSPGYGELPLALQGEICAALRADRTLGIYVTERMLLNPSKTVTAVIGLSHAPQPARIRGCDHCKLRDGCGMRNGGKSCAL